MPKLTKTTVKERFHAKYRKTKTCWLWTASTNTKGYGQIRDTINGKNVAAHRLSYEIHIGLIPKGLQVCHTCDKPPCVNPTHLFLGTNELNHADKVAKGRARGPRGEKSPKAKLTRDQVAEIRRRVNAGEMQKDVALDYPVGKRQISYIMTRSSWLPYQPPVAFK